MTNSALLCDIGNSFLHFAHFDEIKNALNCFDNNKNIPPLRIYDIAPNDLEHFLANFDNNIYYISVSAKNEAKLLGIKNAINMSNKIAINTAYKGLGADRAAACKGIKEGIILDFGTAITIDYMKDNAHLGGYILPGFAGYKNALLSASSILDLNFLDLFDDKIPQNTKEAIFFPLISFINQAIKKEPELMVYISGGDGERFATFFPNARELKCVNFLGLARQILELEL
ncbi:MAG: type III pantothenate kinase [Helicobacter sp.]|nr:type III pantothenate kinase [Helicobacter sp.]